MSASERVTFLGHDNGTMTEERWKHRLKRYLTLVTVEPSMTFYMMAFMITSVVEQAFFVHKACRVNHGFNATICDNLTANENKDINKEVQVTVSNFHQWNDVAGHVGQIILAFFMGAWADRRGRKLPLLMGLIGKFYYSVMIVVNALQESWPVEYIIYTATLPMTITGADVAIFAAAFAYITDISSKESRTLRVTVVEVCYLVTMPTGIAIVSGRYLSCNSKCNSNPTVTTETRKASALFDDVTLFRGCIAMHDSLSGKILYNGVTNRSYAIMFTINASMVFLAILYTFLRLDWRTSENQRPLREANNVITDFFDTDHVVQTFTTLCKRRPNKRQIYLLILILAMAFYTFQRDEKPMMYLYVQLVLNWNFDEFSNFKTYVSALQGVILLCAVPLLSKVFNWRDTCIMMLGAICHSVARIFYATASVDWLLYVGGAFAAIGPVVAPVIRSTVSKIMPAEERGKMFSILAVADNAIPVISGVLYSQIYNATIHTEPASIYFLTIGTQMAVFIIAVIINFTTKEEALVHEDEKLNEGCVEKEN